MIVGMSTPTSAPPSRVPWPPLLFVGSLAIGIGLHLVWPIPLWTGHKLWIAGIVVMLVALAITFWAHHELAAAHTTIRPDRASSALVTTGPFAWTRNPLYVTLIVLGVGVALLINDMWPLLATALLALGLNYIVIPNEERHLRERFPEQYAQYTRRVRRWL